MPDPYPPALSRLTWGLVWLALAVSYCVGIEWVSAQDYEVEYELHLVQADAKGRCREGRSYPADFGALKLAELNAGMVGVHYCLTPAQFQTLKRQLGEANAAYATK